MNILERAFVVSAHINAASEPVSPRQLSMALDIPLSTLYRIIAQLKIWGYVCDSIVSGAVTSGPLFFQHGGNYARFSLLMHAAREGLRELARRSRETVAVIAATPMQTVCVDLVESTQRLRCSFAVGEAQSVVRGCSAKTVLAFRSQSEREAIVDRHILATEERARLHAELETIRRSGFGSSLGEVDANIWGVSAPILKKQQVLGVVTVMVPESRMHDSAFYTREVQECARGINELITLHYA